MYTMKKMFKRLALTLVLALVASMAIAVPAFAAAPPPSADPAVSAQLRKTMLMPAGVTTPAEMTFNFTFTATGTSNSGAAHPALPAVDIVVPAGSANNWTHTVDLRTALATAANQTGVNAGPHEWIVRETVPATNPSAAGMTYDTREFLLRAFFANPVAPATAMTVAYVEVFNITSPRDTVPPELGTKRGDGIPFENIFVPPTGDSTNPALRVTKTIDGDRPQANLNTLFPFTVTLTAPPALGTAPGPVVTPVLPTPLVGTIVLADGSPAPTTVGGASRPTTVNFVDGVATFQLRDGERLNVPTLPGGTDFVVHEAGTPNFRPSVIVTEGGVARPAQGPAAGTGYGTDLTTTPSGIIHNVPTPPNNVAAFTNFYNHATPTGLLIVDNTILIVSALAATALVLLLASRSRKRIEDMPAV